MVNLIVILKFSLPSFFKWIFEIQDGNTKSINITSPNKFFLHWYCIYVPGNCSFFVNYIITAAFIGNIVNLLRFQELIQYIYYKVVEKSNVAIRKVSIEFIYVTF